MKIAIIEHNNNLIRQYKDKILNKDWVITYFTNSIDFGHADVSQFSVIIASCNLPHISGKDVLYSIRNKTKAELYLMSEDTTEFIKPNLNHIKGFLVKKTPEAIIDKLQYTEAKIRINSLLDKEDRKYTEMLNHINGFSFKEKNDIILIGISKTLSEISRKSLYGKIEDTSVNKGIITYPEKDFLSNLDCSQIFDINNLFKVKRKRLIFVNINKHPGIVDTIHMCKLDKVVPTFNEMETAISFLNK